jgi:hypothetical protein
MPRDHKLIDVGPSASGRWSICTASPQFIVDNAAKLPVDKSVFADEGTVAHSLAAKILDGEDIGSVAPDMLAHIRKYTDHVQSQMKASEGKALLHVEQALNLFYLPHRSGIVDAAVTLPDTLYINDLKYGQGVSVEAEGNTQLAIYGESLIQAWSQIMDFPDDLNVVLTIVQPRDRNNHEAVREWRMTRAQLADIAADLKAKAELALAGKGEFKPDPKACQFCPAKGICSAYATQGLKALPEQARVINLPHPGLLTREQRVEVLRAKKVLSQWLDAVEDQEIHDLMQGAEPQGMKLVEGKSNRVWRDADEAQKLLSNHLSMDEMRPRSDLISPAAAERLLKGNELSTRFRNRMTSLITKPEGKATLVLEDDPRPALSFQPDNGLKPLDS